jgi:small subunit ribosomal protein S16
MSVRIRLKRVGRCKAPSYRVVAADRRVKRDGKMLEDLGFYNPLFPEGDARRVSINTERVQHWVSCGAQLSDRCAFLLKKLETAGGAAA